jgi:hypothetical protein
LNFAQSWEGKGRQGGQGRDEREDEARRGRKRKEEMILKDRK